MEKVTLNFSLSEKKILDECIAITKIKPTPLLRALITVSLNETLAEILNDQQVTLPIMNTIISDKDYTVHVSLDEETLEKYETLKRYMPMQVANFTKMLIMPKLKNIKEKKHSIEEILT